AHPELGIVFMGYANVAYVLGYENFALKVKQSGGDGVLIVDLPPEESAEFDAAMYASDLHSIRLLAPTSSSKRCRLVTESASGFLYYVSLTGVTGAKLIDIDEIKEKVEAIRPLSSLPVGVGFGIHGPDQARRIGQFADGIVVGSYFVGQIEKHLGDTCAMIAAMEHAASSIRLGLKRS
ncbi:MAG: tryptophan synthase subunit alpha, partial [Mariprofundaceae bacterium]